MNMKNNVDEPEQTGRILLGRMGIMKLVRRRECRLLFRLFITKGEAERRGVFTPKGLFAFSLLLSRLFRGGSKEVV